jgi:hypothetical protein
LEGDDGELLDFLAQREAIERRPIQRFEPLLEYLD